ncbi:MAG: thioredoxin domain-containing protein [Myxococcales bacterium]|nr:thioredoxin domain-containing protein [Myxococcales bacterium]
MDSQAGADSATTRFTVGQLASHLFGLVLALAGIADAIYLTLLKVENDVTGKADSEICRLGSAQGCAVALESPASSVFGIPVSLFALAAYVVIGASFVLLLLRRGSVPLLASLILGALTWSAALAAYSASVGSWCVLCIGLYIVNTLLIAAHRFATGQFPWSRLGATLGALVRDSLTTLKAAATFVVVVVIGVYVLNSQIARGRELRLGLDARRLDAAVAIGRQPNLWTGAPTLGPVDATLSVLKFSDFQCPHCRRYYEQVEAVVESDKALLRVGFRHFPLSSDCNPFIPDRFHERACPTARAAICAESQGRFFEFAHGAFEGQSDLSDSKLAALASEIGLDDAAFKTCLVAPETDARLRDDILLGALVGVQGTPASVIEGLFFEGGFRAESLKGLAASLPERAKHAAPSPLVAALRAMRVADVRRGSPTEPAVTPPRAGFPVLEQPITFSSNDVLPPSLYAAAEFSLAAGTVAELRLHLDVPTGCTEGGCAVGRRLACAVALGTPLPALRLAAAETASAAAQQMDQKLPELAACLATARDTSILDRARSTRARFEGATLLVDGRPLVLPPGAITRERYTGGTLQQAVAGAILSMDRLSAIAENHSL